MSKARDIYKELKKNKWYYLNKTISSLLIVTMLSTMIVFVPASPFANQKE